LLIAELRLALDDRGRPSRFIRTVHGFGYAFCGLIGGESADTPPDPGTCWVAPRASTNRDRMEATISRSLPGAVIGRPRPGRGDGYGPTKNARDHMDQRIFVVSVTVWLGEPSITSYLSACYGVTL